MATSRLFLSALVGLAVSAGGCGASAPRAPSPGAHARATVVSPQPNAAAQGFSWLVPAPPPPGWSAVRVRAGAMAVPAGWRAVHGDAGTATVQLTDARDHVVGYLNLTPRQGQENLQNWARFRPKHNAQEGDTHITVLGAARGLRFRGAGGSCVRDSYSTITGARFVEIACLLVSGRHGAVIVGAAPPALWARQAPVIERAISATTL